MVADLSRVGFPAVLCALLVGPPAVAEPGLHGLVRLPSDYVSRAYSKSDDRPAPQVNVDFSRPDGLYWGAWLSEVRFGGADVEGIGYLGLRRPLAEGWWLDLAFSQYAYDARVFGRHGDYAELYASVHFHDRAAIGFGFAPDPYGVGHPVAYVLSEVRHGFTDALEGSVSAGFERAAAAYDYDNAFWNAGLTWFPGGCFALDLRLHGARQVNARAHQDRPEGDIGDTALRDRVILSLSCGR